MNLHGFLAPCLLTAGVDLALFQTIYLKSTSLAPAHMLAFIAASVIGFLLFSPVPERFQPRQVGRFTLLVMLVLFLRGGLLASLMQIFAVPMFPAIFITSTLSTILLFTTYLYGQKADASMLCLAAAAYAALLKLCYLGVPELLFEEAYYWNYAQHLDIGYLDHPLIVAWTIKAFTVLLGNTEFAVRLGAFVYWFITAYFVFKLTESVSNRKTAYRALALVALLPAFFSFGFFMSPDAPLTACWSAASYYIYLALIQKNKVAWLKFGIALGLGMSSKYTIALLAIAIMLWVLLDKEARLWLKQPQPYAAALIALTLFSPVIIWNLQHHWLSFTFQSTGRVEHGHHFSLPRFISNILILLTPVGLLTLIGLIANRKWVLNNVPDAQKKSFKLLAWLGLFPVGVYAILSLFTASKLNWTGPCWLSLIPLFAWLITETQGSSPKMLAWCKRAWPSTLFILMLAYGIGLHYLSIGLPGLGFPKNTHLLGFRDLAQQIDNTKQRLEQSTGKPLLVVGMDRNKIASGLAFYRVQMGSSNAASDTASEHLFGEVGLMYELWFPIQSQIGKNMLLVAENKEVLNDSDVTSRATSLGEIGEIDARKNGKVTGRYYYRLLTDYHSN